MAGKATAGPQTATAELFVDMPWLCIVGWPACAKIIPVLSASRALVQYLPSAEEHDLAVAFASHGVHLTSLAVMLAFQKACTQTEDCTSWQRMTGPGFRDVTRLSASPPGFWVTTLAHNRTFVLQALEGVMEELQRFRETLVHSPHQIEPLLQAAQDAYIQWKEGHA
jgi:prephenate dehydrogenase